MHAHLRGPYNLLILIVPDFLCLAEEIAKPRPDMNIKVTAFTKSKKFYYTVNYKDPMSLIYHLTK